MKTMNEQLTQYALYHRDPRNIATHFVGIPMIVYAITILLSRPAVELGGVLISPALVLAVASSIYYICLHLIVGSLMAALLAVCVWGAMSFHGAATGEWLAWGLGLFFVGWVFQFVGHYYEGKKPAFVDDLIGLIIGPLFVVCEALYGLGMLKQSKAVVEAGAGPVAVRQKTSEATQ